MKRLLTSVESIRDAFIVITFAMLIAGLIGQFCNDRYPIISPLMYLPVPVIAAIALLIDLSKRGRTLRGLRFTLSLIALLSLLIESRTLFGFGKFDQPIAGSPSVRLLQWNIMWGGHFYRATEWDDICKKIIDRKPDLIVLSEVPMDESRIEVLLLKLGDGWAEVPFNHWGGDGYLSRMRVISRYNMQVENSASNFSGAAAVVRIDSPKPVRLLLVDGVSGVNDKNQLYAMIGQMLDQDQPIDLVAGDFNATTRNIGFASLLDRGYREASNFDLTYRGTWPAMLPIFGIDHVLVSQKHRILNCRSFQSRGSDHRGTFVDLQIVK